MKFTLTGRHYDITPHLRNYVENKLGKLNRFDKRVVETTVVLFRDSIKDVAEGKVHFGRRTITAKGQGDDMYAAVNDLASKLVSQLERHEGRLRSRKRVPPQAASEQP